MTNVDSVTLVVESSRFFQQDIFNEQAETVQQRLYQLWQYAREVSSMAQPREYLEATFQKLSTALEN